MKTLPKIALSVLAWVVAIVVATVALEVMGRARPGLVPLVSLPLLGLAFWAIWFRPKPFRP